MQIIIAVSIWKINLNIGSEYKLHDIVIWNKKMDKGTLNEKFKFLLAVFTIKIYTFGQFRPVTLSIFN